LAIKELKAQKISRETKRNMVLFGLTLAPASILYITSVNSWSSVSYVNAVSVSQYIITAFAAIYILQEREMFSRKVIAVLAAAIGLLLLS
jgi:drug/metabolite transporter (DMT)-like permease